MTTMHVKTELPFDELLNCVEQLNRPELEKLTAQIIKLQARYKAVSLPKTETALLLKINQGLSPNVQARFDLLVAKRQAETLTEAEHQELLRLTDQIEKSDAERMVQLTELAALRGVSLSSLMDTLKIHPPAYV